MAVATYRRATLSVYLPNYNHGHLISRALDAMLAQSHQPDEILVIDDASRDASVAIIESYCRRYPHVRLKRNQQNQGVARIMQAMPDTLTGDYIYGAAADDVVLPGFFACALTAAKQYPSAGIIFGTIPTYDTTGRWLYTVQSSRWRKPRYATPEQFRGEYLEVELPSQSLSGATIYRRRALQQVGGFRPELGSWLDSFAIRAIGLRFGGYYLAIPAMAWTKYPDSVSQTASRHPRHMLQITRRAAKLMRSAEFQSYFPASHVRQWQRGYTWVILEQWLLSFVSPHLVLAASRQKFVRDLRTKLLRIAS